MNVRNAQNLSMLCDFYELTMSNGYFRNGYKDRITYFDLFFRQVPGRRRLRHCRGAGAGRGIYHQSPLLR